MVLGVEQRGAALSAELDGIQMPFIDDQKWFYVKPDGTLGLYDKPATIWAIICEYICRLFTNHYAQLQNRVIDLTGHLNAYLADENDKDRLQQFLWKHTVVLNALYHACFKLQDRGRMNGLKLEPNAQLMQLALCQTGKNTTFVMMQNNNAQDLHVVMGMVNDSPMYTQTIGTGKQVRVALMGYLGASWDLRIQDMSAQHLFGYAQGRYTIDITAPDNVAISSEPLFCRAYQDQYDRIGKTQEHRVVFLSDGTMQAQRQENGGRSLVIQNTSENLVRVEVTFYNPRAASQRYTIGLVIAKGEEKTLAFNDARFKQKAGALADLDEISCQVILREYGKVLSESP